MSTFPLFNHMWEAFIPYDEIQVPLDDQAVNLRQNVTLGDNMRMIISSSTRPITALEKRSIDVFLKSIRSRGTFQLLCNAPSMQYQGIASNPNVLYSVSSTAAVGDTTITLNTTVNPNILPTGSYVQFVEGGKIYQVTTSSSNTITILPSLYEEVSSGTKLILKDIVGTFRLQNGAPTAQQAFIHRFKYDFDFVEEL